MKTTCLHCGESFEGGVVIVGRPTARLEELVQKLGSHLNTKHPEHAQAMGIYGAAYMGVLFLANFKSDDAELTAERDKQRWMIHQQTLAHRVTDEVLEKRAEELAIDVMNIAAPHGQLETMESIAYAEKCAAIIGLLVDRFTQLRDALEEPNKYELPKVGQLVTN
jgi:hypothetical protein